MSKKRMAVISGLVIVYAVCLLAIWNYVPNIVKNVELNIGLEADKVNDYQVFYTSDKEVTDTSFSKEAVATATLEKAEKKQRLSFEIPSNTTYVRVDLGTGESNFRISSIVLNYKKQKINVALKDLTKVEGYQEVVSYFQDKDGTLVGAAEGEDPYLIWKFSDYSINNMVLNSYSNPILIMHIVLSIIVAGIVIVIYKKRRKLFELPKELFVSRKLIFSLAKNDFKTKYAASYLGVFWAFVQPIVTIAIYTFVFQVGFKAAPTTTGYPFLLYLVSGIVPWFFFSEAWMNATNSLIEYSYLVKKMVFKISILPIVKVISSLFVHLFFIVLAWIIFTVDGKMPGLSLVQVIYYMFCTICLTLALSYFTAAITPFFPDTSQIINILTQIGMWMTPIMYDEAIMGPSIMRILKFNPMYYVVRGYRDAFINGVWFWEEPKMTIYFWVVVCILFTIGFGTFKKLRVHFADVL